MEGTEQREPSLRKAVYPMLAIMYYVEPDWILSLASVQTKNRVT